MPSYSKEVRERAKAAGKWLVMVDFVRPNGTRYLNSQGPMSREEAKVVIDGWLKVIRARNQTKKPKGRPAPAKEAP